MRGFGAMLLTVGLLAASAPAQAAPSQDEPPTAAVSPIIWQACESVGLAVGLTVLAGTLTGVPPEVVVPLNALIAEATGPVLSLIFELCQQIPLPEDPPSCAIDQQVPPLPSLGRPVLLAGLLANELRALERYLGDVGVPFEGALSQAADDLLACAEGSEPEPEAPAPEPVPETKPGPTPDVGSAPGAPPVVSSLPAPPPSSDGAVVPDSAPGLEVAAGRPVTSTSGGTGTGTAIALLVVAGLAALAWVHAGSARRRDTGGRPWT